MNILIASMELAPFAKAGGLGDMTSSLAFELQRHGQDTIAILPKYKFIDVEAYGFSPTDLIIYVPMGYWTEYARLWEGRLPGSDVPVYLVENMDYFNRSGIYGDPYEYRDACRRYIFFSRSVFEAAKALNFKPDIVHAHDFHTAFTMAFLKSQYRYDPLFSGTAGVYTIHNIGYQGWFDPYEAMHFSGFGMKEFYPASWFEFHGGMNSMKTALMFADKITAVSPTYAREIRYPYFGEGMNDMLNYRGADLIGILNGVYYQEWNPSDDKFIFINYGPESLDIKNENKMEFLLENGITEDDDPGLPLIGMVSRLVEQKGIDLLLNKLEYYLANNFFRFALIGSGDYYYEDFFRYIQRKYPKKAIINIGYNNNLAHRIIASSDFLLMPSRYEPCGLTQMYALKYGTIPIVRQTGGLADTVMEYLPQTGKGTGFLFINYNADDMAFAIRRALDVYQVEPHWDIIRWNAMKEDFPSSRTALEYMRVYQWALEKVGR